MLPMSLQVNFSNSRHGGQHHSKNQALQQCTTATYHLRLVAPFECINACELFELVTASRNSQVLRSRAISLLVAAGCDGPRSAEHAVGKVVMCCQRRQIPVVTLRDELVL